MALRNVRFFIRGVWFVFDEKRVALVCEYPLTLSLSLVNQQHQGIIFIIIYQVN